MTDKVFIDSNVWIYLFTNEITNVLKRKKFTETEIRYIIESISKICVIQDYSKEILLFASELRENYNFSVWDSIVVSCASISGCCLLISEDMQNKMKIKGLTIKNIFVA